MGTTFRTAVVRTPGGPDSIEIIDVPLVEPGPGQVRVEIAAAAVNPVDLAVADGLFHRRGRSPARSHRAGLGLRRDRRRHRPRRRPPDREPGRRADRRVRPRLRHLRRAAVVAASDVAVVPDDLDLTAASTVPLNSLAAAQMVDLLGDGDGRSLLVTGAAGAVGGNVIPLAQDRGWRVTGLARAEDEEFVRRLGADFTAQATPGWDAVADGAVLQEQGLALVRDGGTFVGVQPGAAPASERGVTVRVVVTEPDGGRLAQLLDATASGHLPGGCTPSFRSTTSPPPRAVGKGGVRGRYVLQP